MPNQLLAPGLTLPTGATWVVFAVPLVQDPRIRLLLRRYAKAVITATLT